MTNLLTRTGTVDEFTAASFARTPHASQAAVIVNASKFSARHLRRFTTHVNRSFVSRGWLPPVWLETTASTRGTQEARLAIRAQVDLVLVVGGDGTVRTVAQELAGHDVPLAVLPRGTGNLLARNLGIPRRDIDAAVEVACAGTDRRIDLGWLELDEDGEGRHTDRFVFLVMAGAGFDADTMAGANHTMKTGLGPTAYLISGARAVQRRMSPATVTVDGTSGGTHKSRGIIVGNCGRLTMGLTLMPEADPADGILDGVVLHQRTLVDWARALVAVIARSRTATPLMPRVRGQIIEYRTKEPQPVEVDGDVVGNAVSVRFEVQPAALLVRTARPIPTEPSLVRRGRPGKRT